MEPDNGPSLTSAFPPPPPFYKFFTSDNVLLLKSGHVPNSAEEKRQLQYLVPPPAPTEGAYSTFGDTWPLPERLPSLSEMGVRQLYSSEPDLDRTAELRSLTKSALMNYLELVGIMGIDPAGWTEKIDDLRIIFVNMHHLLNEYRPHQARETLCMMMEEEIERTREEINGIEEACEKVEKVLENVMQSEGMLSPLRDESPQEEQNEEGKMEDVVAEIPPVGTEIPVKVTERKWYEDDNMSALWGNGM